MNFGFRERECQKRLWAQPSSPPHPTSRRRKSEKTRSDTGRAPKISEYQSGADRNRMRNSFDDSAAEK